MLKSNLSNPPHFFKAYKSNINRAPRKKFFKITKGLTMSEMFISSESMSSNLFLI